MPQKFSTAKTVLDKARIRLSDPNGTQYGSEELLMYLNTAIRLFARKIARLWPQYQVATTLKSYSVQDLVEDQTEYELPKDLYEVLDILVSGDEVDPVPVPNVDEEDGYYIKNAKLVLTTAPDEDEVEGLEIVYFSHPPTLETEDEQVPFVADAGDVFVTWVTLRAENRNDEDFQGTLMMAKYMQQLVQGHIAKTNKPREMALPVKDWQEKSWI